MAKRLTDTDKWKKRFIRELPAQYKLLWLYMLDECDHAGVWIVDFDVARLRLGEEVNEQDALKYLDEQILKIDDGDRWLILDFIDFQYGILNEENRVHNSVIKTLRKYGLWHEEEKIIIRNKDHVSPLQGAKDKDKEKDKDKVKEKARTHLFKNSPFYDFELFEKEFENTDYQYCDLRIYYEKVKNWSASGGKMKIDWIATARNFMIGDKEKNKLSLKDGTTGQAGNNQAIIGNKLNGLITAKYGNRSSGQ